MELQGNKTQKKSKTPISTIVMYVSAIIVALLAIASLINNVRLFTSNVTQYVAQGYTRAVVLKQLVPGQLLPGIFEPIAVYGGIAVVLVGAGIINSKLTRFIKLSAGNDVIDNSTEENTPDVVLKEQEAAAEQADTVKQSDSKVD